MLLLLIAGWLGFVAWGKRDRMSYLALNLPTVAAGQVMGWRSDRLFFAGWSPAERSRRDSNSKTPSICFKPRLDEHATGSRRITISVEANVIAPLLGQIIGVVINGQESNHRMTPDSMHRFEYREANPSPSKLICIKFGLPLSLKNTWDYRGAGMTFRSLKYDVAS